MSYDEPIYKEFLSELKALDEFRQRYQDRHPGCPLQSEDPDLRRLIEALAYFTVRTRMATLKNLQATWQQTFKSYFDYLLTPSPAVGMLQAVVTERMTEAAVLPAGAAVHVATADDSVGSFRTLRALRVLPVTLERSEVIPLREGRSRLVLTFVSRLQRLDPVGVLSLHVRYLDSYVGALRFHHQLRICLEQVSVLYDEPADEHKTGAPCASWFGAAADAAGADADDPAHPLEQIRGFFHFPEQELFLHVRVPASQRAWRRFSLCFDLDARWPVQLRLSRDLLQPFVVPVINLRREPAQPILCDGTRQSFPIRHKSPGRDFALHSVTGVFQITDRGLAPLRPGVLPGTPSSGEPYEIEETEGELGRQQWLVLRMPGAFTEPRRISVDALWYQPRFAQKSAGRLKISLPDRLIDGLGWQLLGGVRPHRESPLRDEPLGLLQMLSLKMKPLLSRTDVLSLLEFLGPLAGGPFAGLPGRIRELSGALIPDSAPEGSGVKHRYRVMLEHFDPEDEGLVWHFFTRVRQLLDAWSATAAVELEINAAGSALSLPLQ